MPYLDEYGLWRHDKPQLVATIVVEVQPHQYVRKIKPYRCPVCGGRVEMDCDSENANYDYDLALEYGYEDPNSYSPNGAELFEYVHDYVCCVDDDECRYIESCGRTYYYNPKDNCYDLPSPLTKRESILAELKALEAAGQMRLFR